LPPEISEESACPFAGKLEYKPFLQCNTFLSFATLNKKQQQLTRRKREREKGNGKKNQL